MKRKIHSFTFIIVVYNKVVLQPSIVIFTQLRKKGERLISPKSAGPSFANACECVCSLVYN